ncbi:MAG: VWA domain-containing protein [Acidobacteriota bacterium]
MVIATTLLACVLLLSLAGHPIPARQNEPSPSPQANYTATVEVVRVPVVVVDEQGSFIDGLRRKDFTIWEGGDLQRVEYFLSEHDPTSVVILLDASSAMAPFAQHVREAVGALAADLRGEDELSLVEFEERAEILSPLSMDHARLLAVVEGYRPLDTPGRALSDAVALGLSILENAAYEKRALLVLCSGADTSSRIDRSTVMRAAQRSGVSINVVLLAEGISRRHSLLARRRSAAPGAALSAMPVAGKNGPPAAQSQAVEELAHFSGGVLAVRPGIEERFGGVGGWLEKACVDICRYLNHQYVLHYMPQNPPSRGVWREIKVRLRVPYKEVRSRSGYVR